MQTTSCAGQKSDIWSDALSMSNIQHSTVRPIESKKSDPTMRRVNKICLILFVYVSTNNNEFLLICLLDSHTWKFNKFRNLVVIKKPEIKMTIGIWDFGIINWLCVKRYWKNIILANQDSMSNRPDGKPC